jgi:DNA adenine methylase
MPYTIRKLPNQNLYKVYNTETKTIHSYATTLENANKQVKLLHMVDAGVPLKKQGGSCWEGYEAIGMKKKNDKLVPNCVPIHPLEKGDPKERMKRVEVSGGNFAEDGKNLKPFIGRIGSKTSLIKDIIPIIPSHKIYVELFVGGGSIFWNKLPAEKSIINDLDKKVIESYKLLKKVPLNSDLTFLDNKSIAEIQKFVDNINENSSVVNKLIASFKYSRGTFNSSGKGKIYQNIKLDKVERDLKEFKQLLKNTTILNQDYIKVIKKYDSPNTFFFLDPPYEESDNLYNNSTIDYEKMRDLLKTIKGKFLLSINDSKYISNIFKDFFQKKVSVSNVSNSPMLETKNRKELIITNYDMKGMKGGSIETDNFINEGIVSLPEFRSVKIDLPTYMYKRMPDIKGKPPPYRYRLVIPITKARNISSRKQQTSIDISQKPVSIPEVNIEENNEKPKIEDFSPSDRVKIQEYYLKVMENEDKEPNEIEKDPYEVKQRGKPLPCSGSKKEKPVLERKKTKEIPKEETIEIVPVKKNKVKKPIEKEEPKKEEPKKEEPKKEEPKKEEPKPVIVDAKKYMDLIEKGSNSRDEIDRLVKILDSKKYNPGNYKVILNNLQILVKRLGRNLVILKTMTPPNELLKSYYKGQLETFRKGAKIYKLEVGTYPVKERPKKEEPKKEEPKKEELKEITKEEEDALDDYFSEMMGKGIKNKISVNNKKMSNPWIMYVKEYASKNGMSYRDALKDPKCKAGYKKPMKGAGVIDEIGKDELIAIMNDDSGLGANAGKKYISL